MVPVRGDAAPRSSANPTRASGSNVFLGQTRILVAKGAGLLGIRLCRLLIDHATKFVHLKCVLRNPPQHRGSAEQRALRGSPPQRDLSAVCRRGPNRQPLLVRPLRSIISGLQLRQPRPDCWARSTCSALLNAYVGMIRAFSGGRRLSRRDEVNWLTGRFYGEVLGAVIWPEACRNKKAANLATQ